MIRLAAVPLFAFVLCLGSVQAGDWIHWRGPMQNGHSLEKNLPDSWEPTTPGKDNLVWKQPYGCRSAPLVMNGRLYFITSVGEGVNEGEEVVCLDEKTGKKLWNYKFNVFHTDIVSSRLGWTYLTADPKLEYVYAHGTQGLFFCFDKEGKIVWSRSLTEEFGRVSGYGGRIPSPICDSGLVIQGMINGSWGDQGRGSNRYVAMDAKTGEVVWWSAPTVGVKSTHNSNPVVAVINGERLLISGGGEGFVHAIQVRTGKVVWTYPFAEGVVNGSPVVVGNMIYVGHGDGTLDGSGAGSFICLDGSKIENGKPKLVWDYSRGVRFGLANPAYADGKIYAPDDFAKLHCFDAKTGKLLWKFNYGRLSRGSPLIADGKCYIFDVNSNFRILTLDGSEEPEEAHETFFKDTTGLGFVETNCTPIAVNGRVYFATRDEMYAIGLPDHKNESVTYPAQPKETDGGTDVAWLQVLPADTVAKTGDEVKFSVNAFNKLGQALPEAKLSEVKWTLPTPPVPPMAKSGPPPINGEISGGVVKLNPKMVTQQGYVDATLGMIKGRARLRVAPQIPYVNDFEKTPEGAAPSGWVNAQGKFVVQMLEGNKVLMKLNTSGSPPLARANAYVTLPNTADYTIECDMMATEVRERLPDMGLFGARYTFVLDGKTDSLSPKRRIRIGAWEAIPRVKQETEFDWKANVWYRTKLSVKPLPGNKALVQAKVWPKEDKEPEAWNLEYTDVNALPQGHQEGSAGVYGFVTNVLDKEPGSAIYYDNLKITSNKK